MTSALFTIELRFEQDLASVRQRARQIAGLLGFDAMDQARISSAVAEVARSALVYAHGGTLEFLLGAAAEGMEDPALLVSVTDRGPGLEDTKAILDGTSGAGLGIATARRFVDIFAIDSTPGRGTVVLLGKRLPRKQAMTAAELADLRREIEGATEADPYEDIRRENRELVRTVEALRARQEDLERRNRALEETNRGVVNLYAELDDKALDLRRADQLKTRFLSNMSHEFRTPLNSIVALSRLLLDHVHGPLSEEQAKQVHFIQRAALGLTELVDDLLDIAKVEAGRTRVKPTTINVAELFAELRGMFHPLAAGAQLRLVFEEPAPMPVLCTDCGNLAQILRNVISNALKFTERGQVLVSARYHEPQAAIVFSVSDTGIGIATEDQERIFQEFAQVEHPIQARVRGTGLGLPLAHKLAQLLGGSLTVESAPGAGSTFRLSVPLIYPGTQSASEAASHGADATRYPVLVVEDDPQEILLYEKYLKRTGFQPLAAAGIPQARELLYEIQPTALILEAKPGIAETWDFLAELKAGSLRGLPVLVVSEAGDEQRARALGAEMFSCRPLNRSWLLGALRKAAEETPAHPVLIIDDDEPSRYLLRELLSDTRYDVLEAASGEEGLRLAREHLPSAILLDLVMPGMSGVEVLAHLAADPRTRDLPVIIVTSKTLEESELRALASHTVAIWPKQQPSRQKARETLRDSLIQAESRPRRISVPEVRNAP